MMRPFQTLFQAFLSLMPQSRIDFLKNKQIKTNPKESGKSFQKSKVSLCPPSAAGREHTLTGSPRLFALGSRMPAKCSEPGTEKPSASSDKQVQPHKAV